MDYIEFAGAILLYTKTLNASVTSWLRTDAHNAAVGGVKHSAHLIGIAVDVIYDETPPLPDRRNWATRLGLRLIEEADHDHLQPMDWTAG